MDSSTVPFTQRTVRRRHCSAWWSPGGRRYPSRRPALCQGPISRASRTMTHPAEVRQVVSSTMVPGRYRRPAGTTTPSGPSRNPPAALSSIAPNTLGASGLGRHSHSTFPLGATSALTSRSERKAYSSIAGKGLRRSRGWYPRAVRGGRRGDATASSPRGCSAGATVAVSASAALTGRPRRSSAEDSIPRIRVLGVKPALLLAADFEVEDAGGAGRLRSLALRAHVAQRADVFVVREDVALLEPESEAGHLPSSPAVATRLSCSRRRFAAVATFGEVRYIRGISTAPARMWNPSSSMRSAAVSPVPDSGPPSDRTNARRAIASHTRRAREVSRSRTARSPHAARAARALTKATFPGPTADVVPYSPNDAGLRRSMPNARWYTAQRPSAAATTAATARSRARRRLPTSLCPTDVVIFIASMATSSRPAPDSLALERGSRVYYPPPHDWLTDSAESESIGFAHRRPCQSPRPTMPRGTKAGG